MTTVMAMIMRQSWMLLISTRLFNQLAQRQAQDYLTNRGRENIPADGTRLVGEKRGKEEFPAMVPHDWSYDCTLSNISK